ncbi:MAG: cupin domain-containing protein [Candidatus Saccharibacteria bacterium]
MKIITINEEQLKETPRGVQGRPLVDLPDVHLMNLVLAPSQKVPVHTTPVDVLFHVVEGRGRVTIGEETQAVKAGQIVISPAHIPHALEADEESSFEVLVYKTPNPKEK